MQIEIADSKVFDMIAHMTQQLFEDEQSVKCLSIEGHKERLINYINSGYAAYLFYKDGVVIGYALVNLGRNPYYIMDFFICREQRRQKYGTEAFNELLNLLQTECVELDVFAWNERGKKFWISLGFNDVAVIMRKGGFYENK